jgi:predicted nucleic acid-binding protein
VTVVIDASFLVAALVDSGPGGRWAESIVEDGSVFAPELVLVETANVLRRLERTKQITSLEATSAHRDALRLDLGLFPYEPFAQRIWELRDNLTSDDAWYVALAEALECPLATLDVRLGRASGPTCAIITPSSAR